MRWMPSFATAVVTALVLGFATWFTYQTGIDAGRLEIKSQWAAADQKERERQAQRTQQLQLAMDQLNEAKSHEIDALHARVRTLSDSLRKRPERPTPGTEAAAPAAPVASCTGAELYREDAAFLVGEAERADTIRLELRQCYAAYGHIEGLN